MYIIEVIPLAVLPPQAPQLLSYFLNKPLAGGSVVEISMGNRKIPAVVVSSVSLEERKAILKSSDFQLKKISGIISETQLVSDIQLKIAFWLSKYYYAPLGLCLRTVLPPFFLKKNYEIQIQKYEIRESKPEKPLILLSRAKDIIKNIEPEVKKTLNAKKQVLIIAPEISTAKYFYDHFAGYYETAVIHSKVALRQYHKSWEKISAGDTEVVIGTRQALFTPFADLGLIVMEDPANSAYKSDMSPKYNTDDLSLKIAGIYGCDLIYVSQIPDIKRYYLASQDLCRIEDKNQRPDSNIVAVDMVQEIRSGNYSIFSRRFIDRLVDGVKKKKKVLLLSSRKGYSSVFLCGNCGLTAKCPNCSVPLRPHSLPVRALICYRCSAIQKIPDSCRNCNSYKLLAAGFPGTQKLAEEFGNLIDKNQLSCPVFILDSSVVKTPKDEEGIIEQMDRSDSFACIATQMIFGRRFDRKFDLVGIASLDGLTSMPDFKAEEELFTQFHKILDFQPDEVFIQTYNADGSLVGLLAAGNYEEFYKNELEIRKLFRYPPFTRLVKLSIRQSDPQKAEEEARILGAKLKMAISQRKLDQSVKVLGPSPAFIAKERGLYVYNMVLKVIPEQKMDEILRFVPSNWMIDVDPKSIL